MLSSFYNLHLFHQCLTTEISHTSFTKPQKKYEYYKCQSPSDHVIIGTDQNKIHTSITQYQSSLDVILKIPLIVYGYIRKYKQFYPKEIIQIIYKFYFIKILNYKIKGIGNNQYGQQGIGNRKNIQTLTTSKTYQKQIKNIINGYQSIYILFTDSTYECCGNNIYGQLGINMYSHEINTFVENNNIKI
eukprot:128659_1